MVQLPFSPRRSVFTRTRARIIATSLVCTMLLYDSTASAINALVSHDLPILTEIAATELASYAELGAFLGEAAAITAQVKEYTTLAKTAWGAINELRHLTWDELRGAALLGVGNAFPELGQIYGDVQDIRDLNYRDEQALMTLRGMLWEGVYGPGIDYLHAQPEACRRAHELTCGYPHGFLLR